MKAFLHGMPVRGASDFARSTAASSVASNRGSKFATGSAFSAALDDAAEPASAPQGSSTKSSSFHSLLGQAWKSQTEDASDSEETGGDGFSDQSNDSAAMVASGAFAQIAKKQPVESEASPSTTSSGADGSNQSSQPNQGGSDVSSLSTAPIDTNEIPREILALGPPPASNQPAKDESLKKGSARESDTSIPTPSVFNVLSNGVQRLDTSRGAEGADSQSGDAAEENPLPPTAAPAQGNAPAVQSDEIAFALRLTPDGSALETNTTAAPNADPAASAKTLPQGIEKQLTAAQSLSQASSQISDASNQSAQAQPSPAAAVSAAAPLSAAASLSDRFAKPDLIPPASAAIVQNPSASPAKNNAEVPSPSPSARMDQMIEPPQPHSSSNHDITVRLADAAESGANVHISERGGEIRVSVRTPDAELAQTLRGGLNDLVGRLDHNGIRAEVWRPGSDTAYSQNDSQNGNSGQRGNQSGAGRNSSGQQSPEDNRQGSKRPRWVEELETSIGFRTTPADR